MSGCLHFYFVAAARKEVIAHYVGLSSFLHFDTV